MKLPFNFIIKYSTLHTFRKIKNNKNSNLKITITTNEKTIKTQTRKSQLWQIKNKWKTIKTQNRKSQSFDKIFVPR